MLKKIERGFIAFWSSPKCVFWLGMIIALTATSLEVFRGRNTNYFDYQDSTRMLFEGITPYTMEFPQAHSLYFLYLPSFCVVFAPIFLLPWWLGPYVWNIGNYCLYALSIKTLPEKFDKYKHWIFLFMLPVLLQAIFCYQYNTIVAYIFIFAYSLLERNKGFWAVLLIMISACTKVYGGAELALLLCYPKAWKNYGYAILCGSAVLCLPLAFQNIGNPFDLYQQMYDVNTSHHNGADFIGLLFARGLKPLLLPNYREVQVGMIALLGILFFASYKRWKDPLFKVRTLTVISGFIILFSDCPETHTYLIALAPYAMAFWMQKKREWYDWVLFCSLIFNFGIIPTDVLCPAWIHEWIHCTLWLDVYTYFFCWLRVLWLAVGPTESVRPYGKMLTATVMIALAVCLTINWKDNFDPFAPQPQPDFTQQSSLGETDPNSAVAVGNSIASTENLPPAWIATQKTVTVRGVTFHMNLVQGGSFLMGNSAPADIMEKDEYPAHKVRVNTFYMGDTEVTQALWTAVMHDNAARQKGDDMPVEYVTYEMVHEFLDSLNNITGMKFRLPSEAEWEYAAQGGSKSQRYHYSGSNNIDEVAHNIENNPYHRHFPVAQKKPNELGLYDMSGNVWEWCEDAYALYGSKEKSSNFHVMRGGAYDCTPQTCRPQNRYMYDKRRRRDTVGFRLAL